MNYDEIFKRARILPDNPSCDDRFNYGDLRLLVQAMIPEPLLSRTQAKSIRVACMNGWAKYSPTVRGKLDEWYAWAEDNYPRGGEHFATMSPDVALRMFATLDEVKEYCVSRAQ